MKLIIKSIFFFTIFTFSSYGNEIHYNINAVKDKLEITVEFIGNASGVTEVLIPVLSNINYKHIKAKSVRSELRIVNNGENGKREMNCSNIFPNVCSIFHILHKPNYQTTIILTDRRQL